MGAFARRLLLSLFFCWSVVTITFFLIHLTPGDPVDLMVEATATPRDREALKKELGLDKPLLAQYEAFFGGALRGDLGKSFLTKKQVTSELTQALPSTITLAFTSVLFSILLGLPLGIAAAAKKGTPVHFLVLGYSTLGVSMPSFIIAPLLILFFSLKLDLLPVSGNGDLSSIILPTVSLGISLGAVLANMTRASLLEVLNSDFITTARAKGVGEREIFLKHALKNALTPIITTISFQFGAVLTGVVITETIFDWPGIGVLLYSALQSRNYPLVQGCVLTIAMLYILVNLVTDVLYFVVNPRLRET